MAAIAARLEMIAMDQEQQLVSNWVDRLRTAGLNEPEILSAAENPKSFGNAEATLRVGVMLIQIVRDRGQELLSVAFDSDPDHFYPIEDIEVAMGWQALEDITSREELEQLDLVLSRLAEHFDQLADAISSEREQLTLARIERAKRERSKAFIDRLRG